MTVENLVDELDARLSPLERAVNRAWWEANIDANDDTSRRRAETEVAWSDALADRDAFVAIRERRAAGSSNALVERRLHVLEQLFAPQQVDADLRRETIALQTDIESRFARFRARIGDDEIDENGINEILRTSDDVARRKAAWEASKTVGVEVATDVRHLAHLRNAAASSLGYRDHFAMSLRTTDFDEARLMATLDEVEQITRDPFVALKRTLDERLAGRFGCDASALRPWHYDDPFFQTPPQAVGVSLDEHLEHSDLVDLTVRTFEGMGLDVNGVLARSDLLPRDGKVQHAFCIDVDRAGDVRVLCNNVPGETWTETMLHEFGHAVYFVGVGRDLPWALRTMDSCLTEGIAMLCGRLVQDPDWLSGVAGVATSTVSELAPR
ncbi:MAG TPA: M2 family metallopeptidase, partial [Acidimicrobiia bacterium]|nr:M2 family metallopeptidase [Acidimicrobiia bacterium]